MRLGLCHPCQACQQKFDEWGGSLRGRQEEVALFSKAIGLSALQVEKRFHYIRKHYEKVSQRLTVDESIRGYDTIPNPGPVFSMCPGRVTAMPVEGSVRG